MSRSGLAWVALASVSLACAGPSSALDRGQRYYEDNQYEKALALWRHLERRSAALTPAERARYAYLRGMTDYRLGFREEARHWLAVARGVALESPGALAPGWAARLDGALLDLEREVFGLHSDGRDMVQTIELPAAEVDGASSDPPPTGAEPAAQDPERRP